MTILQIIKKAWNAEGDPRDIFGLSLILWGGSVYTVAMIITLYVILKLIANL
jgi:hypothetical protein